MFKKIFKKENKKLSSDKYIMVTALLIHAAKMDENYTEVEKKIIEKALCDLTKLPGEKAREIIDLAEKKSKIQIKYLNSRKK